MQVVADADEAQGTLLGCDLPYRPGLPVADLDQQPAARREELLRHVETTLRPALCPNGQWFADYRRLRVVARRIPV